MSNSTEQNEIHAIDAVINAFFGEFDNRSGRQPEFEHFAALFTPTAMIYKHDGETVEAMTVCAFIEPRAAMLTNGTLTDFYEWEAENQTIIDGSIASRICRFGKAGFFNGETYQGGGRKHIQLLKTDKGWQITSVIWQDD